jgi:coxsackievirus/adenovirus receptor
MTIFKLAFAIATLFFSACVLETAEDENNSNPNTSSNIEMSSGKEISSTTEMSSNTPISSSSQEIKPCTKEYAPVCAEGKTFGNACEARSVGHQNFHQGTCEEFQICTEEYAPVCAEGKTFSNTCKARAAEHQNFRQGACDDFQICTKEYAPVCAEGKTFGNACEAKAAGHQNFSQGVCESICLTIKVLKPICLVGNSTPVYDDGGCLIDYKCPSSEAQCHTLDEKACLNKERCEWNSISTPVVLSQDLDSQTLNPNNSPVEGFCASKQPSVCPVFSMTPDFCSQGKTLAWESDSMGCESPVCK